MRDAVYPFTVCSKRLDPLTHILAGSVMSRAGLNRKTGLATAVLAISAEIPDIDVLTNFDGPVLGFGNHRGITHTFAGVPLMAAASVAIVYAWYRWMLKRGKQPKLPPNWKLLYGYALIGCFSHILLDFTNNYGVRPLSPFHHAWYSWDIVYILEPLITGPLLLALVIPWFFGLVGSEVGARKNQFPGRASAVTALVFIALVWWVRDYNHRRAITLLHQQNYTEAEQEPLRLSASPNMLNPFSWRGIVETETAFVTLPVNTWTNQVDPQQQAVTRYKPEETPVTIAAKSAALARVYLDWARHPYTEVFVPDKPGGDTVVRIRDLRFDYPEWRERPGGEDSGPAGPQPSLSILITLDPQLRVVEQRMGRQVEK
jgi:inner membrane protein